MGIAGRGLVTIGVAASLALLAGCEVPSAAERARLNALIGHSDTDLLRAYGVPTRTYTAQGHDFLAYVQGWTDVTPGFGGYGPWGGFGPWGGWGGWGGGYGLWGGYGGFPPTVSSYTCATTFEIVAHRVVAWSLHGDGC